MKLRTVDVPMAITKEVIVSGLEQLGQDLVAKFICDDTEDNIILATYSHCGHLVSATAVAQGSALVNFIEANKDGAWYFAASLLTDLAKRAEIVIPEAQLPMLSNALVLWYNPKGEPDGEAPAAPIIWAVNYLQTVQPISVLPELEEYLNDLIMNIDIS